MARMIFPNLPVRDLKRIMDFFSQLGFTFNMKFTDENAACLKINDLAYVMLLKEPFFSSFITKKIPDTSKTSEIILAVSCDKKDEVDALLTKAIKMGAAEGRKEDLGFMYSRAFQDLDGHQWEFFWMDESRT